MADVYTVTHTRTDSITLGVYMGLNRPKPCHSASLRLLSNKSAKGFSQVINTPAFLSPAVVAAVEVATAAAVAVATEGSGAVTGSELEFSG
jgi:hypothetical protein